jgi:hypothetical protein
VSHPRRVAGEQRSYQLCFARQPQISSFFSSQQGVIANLVRGGANSARAPPAHRRYISKCRFFSTRTDAVREPARQVQSGFDGETHMATSQVQNPNLSQHLDARRDERRPFNREAAIAAIGIGALFAIALVYLWVATR